MSAATTAPVELRDAELAGWHEWVRPWPVAIAAVLAAGVTAALTISAGVLVRPGGFALFAGYSVVAFAGVGLLWRRRRPQSLVGLVLLLLAAALAVVALQGTSWSLGFSIGVLFDPVSALLAWYLLLSYPGVRLTRAAMWVFALAVSTILVGFVPWYFLSPTISGATFLARCTAECPPNALMIADRPDVAGHFATVEEVFRVVFAIAVVVLLVSRLVLATPAPHPRSGLCGRLCVDRRVRSLRRHPLLRRHRAALVGHARLVPDGSPCRSAARVRTGASARTDFRRALARNDAAAAAGTTHAGCARGCRRRGARRSTASPGPAAVRAGGLGGHGGGADRPGYRPAGPSLARARQRPAADGGSRL